MLPSGASAECGSSAECAFNGLWQHTDKFGLYFGASPGNDRIPGVEYDFDAVWQQIEVLSNRFSKKTLGTIPDDRISNFSGDGNADARRRRGIRGTDENRE